MIKTYKEIKKFLQHIPNRNERIKKKAIEHQNKLLKPKNSLGILEDLAVFFCSWKNSLKPKIKISQTIIFAGNHGICNQSVNTFLSTSMAKNTMINSFFFQKKKW